jgi:DNA adenine methylase
MKPLLKWIGGKTQILSDVLSTFPETIADYHEPFLGGGSVLLAVLPRVTGTVYASDVNPSLINFYTMVKTFPEHLITCLRVLQDEYNSAVEKEVFYYKMRDLFNKTPKMGPEAGALFLFLNKAGFRGMYREGPNGFNVPFGHYKSVSIVEEDQIRNVSKAVQRVVFTCQGFEDSLKYVKPGDFVYADPPYVPETLTSFVGYVADGFDKHEHLFTMLKSLPCLFVMSNADVAVVHESFGRDYDVKKVLARRAIHARDPSTRTMEVLIIKI